MYIWELTACKSATLYWSFFFFWWMPTLSRSRWVVRGQDVLESINIIRFLQAFRNAVCLQTLWTITEGSYREHGHYIIRPLGAAFDSLTYASWSRNNPAWRWGISDVAGYRHWMMQPSLSKEMGSDLSWLVSLLVTPSNAMVDPSESTPVTEISTFNRHNAGNNYTISQWIWCLGCQCLILCFRSGIPSKAVLTFHTA